MSRSLDPGTLRKALARWRADPVLFCSEVLGFEPWEKQREFMRTIAARQYVACRSGHKVGKTTALAAIALWYITCFPKSRVVLTAPAAPQIERGMWAELSRLYVAAAARGFPLGGTLAETPWTGLRFADGRDVFGRSTNKKENLAGISAPNLLFLVDEASGISEDIFEAIFGKLGGGGRVVLISNPTQLSGRFYDAFHARRDHWALVHISSEDTPNFHGGSIPGLAEPGWAAMMRAEWGFPSAHYDVRILGKFPSQAANAVIGFGLVEQGLRRGELLGAVERGELRDAPASLLDLVAPLDPLELGVDVARYGDDWTCFAPVRGLRMYEPALLQSLDVLDVAGRAHEFAGSLARFDEEPVIRVDANGLGAGVFDALRRRERCHAVDVNVSRNASDTERYVRLRDELWFGMRAWLERGGVLPASPRLAAELIAPTYSFDVRGRRQVESKKDIKVRLGKSPDAADAACLAVYRAAAAPSDLTDLYELLPRRRV